MSDFKLSGAADNAMAKLQDTDLNPMEETLFQAWAKANQIKKTDLPNDVVDYRGIYKHTNGYIMPHGQLKRVAAKVNDEYKLEQVLQDQMQDKLKNLTKEKTGELDAAKTVRDAVDKPGAETS